MQVKPKSTTGFICTRALSGYLDHAGQRSTRAAESCWRFGVIHQLSSLRRMAERLTDRGIDLAIGASSGAQKTQGNYCTICCTIPDTSA